MATLLRQSYTRPIPANATTFTKDGDTCVRFTGRDGKTIVGVVLANKPGQCRVQTKTWYAQYTTAEGEQERVSLKTTNKIAAQKRLAELLDKVTAKQCGRVDNFTEYASVPLRGDDGHIAAWQRNLAAAETTAKHVKQMVDCVRKIVDGCEFIFVGDITASGVQDYLGELRKPVEAIVVPMQDEFTRKEIAALLGVGPQAITNIIGRHGLQATGPDDVRRRYPRATVEAIVNKRARVAMRKKDEASKSISAQTANRYLTAMRAFCRWLAIDKRIPDNPLAHVQGFGSAETDRRHERRFLTAIELRRLFEAASASAATFRNLTGPDRAIIYRVAIMTGFRSNELAELAVGSFHLDAPTPTVRLKPKQTKNKKEALQPLPSDLVALLRPYLQGRPASERVWPGTWHERSADMMRLDLEAAGIPFAIVGHDGSEFVADFHALRHSAGILAEAGGASLREVMQFMRHSDPKLTMRTYGRLRVGDMVGTVSNMGKLLGTDDTSAKGPANTTAS